MYKNFCDAIDTAESDSAAKICAFGTSIFAKSKPCFKCVSLLQTNRKEVKISIHCNFNYKKCKFVLKGKIKLCKQISPIK